MFILRSVSVFHGLQAVVALSVLVLLGAVGFLVQYCLTRQGAPLMVKLLPGVISGLIVLLLLGFSKGLVSLSPAFYNTMVRGGVLSVWGFCGESFLLGCLIGWIVILIHRFKKK